MRTSYHVTQRFMKLNPDRRRSNLQQKSIKYTNNDRFLLLHTHTFKHNQTCICIEERSSFAYANNLPHMFSNRLNITLFSSIDFFFVFCRMMVIFIFQCAYFKLFCVSRADTSCKDAQKIHIFKNGLSTIGTLFFNDAFM